MDKLGIVDRLAKEASSRSQSIADRVAADSIRIGDPVWNTVKGFIKDVSLEVANTGTVSRDSMSKLDLVSKSLKGFEDKKLAKESEAVAKAAAEIVSEIRKISNKMVPAYQNKLDKLYGNIRRIERG